MNEKLHIALHASDVSAGQKVFPLITKAAETRGSVCYALPLYPS